MHDRGRLRGGRAWRPVGEGTQPQRCSPRCLGLAPPSPVRVGGYLDEYRRFAFTAVRRAGHEAPYTARARTAHLYRLWLTGKDIV